MIISFLQALSFSQQGSKMAAKSRRLEILETWKLNFVEIVKVLFTKGTENVMFSREKSRLTISKFTPVFIR